MDSARIGTALVGGYVLGRTKKAKLALGLAMALAGSRVKPGQLGKTLAHSPFLNSVNEQVRGELMTAGKAAATTVLNARAGRLADTLHDRTEELRGEKQDEAEEKDEHEEKDGKDERNGAGGGNGGSPSRRSRSSSGRGAPAGAAKKTGRQDDG
ncbi:hypothetical protein [Streptomyces filamentosus]|uniref:hypothetical protein n=1 Tax=Streptomyces filamentosus TaxID=67294 RepID=UPI00123B27E9|nr:hypothetical protein [Streptomyces filamentosus]KAA6216329.1 hypothetical protein CP979_04770 [Streptomyces filamentosus]